MNITFEPKTTLRNRPHPNLDLVNALKRCPPGLYSESGVTNSNTYSPTITTPCLQPDSIGKIVNAFAPLAAYSITFDPAPYSPQSTNVLKLVSNPAATQINPTTFENGGDQGDAVQVAVSHYSQQWEVANSEYQSGIRIEDAFEENALQLGSTISGVVCTLFTAANFPATAIVSAPGAFGLSDAAAAHATIKKSPVKNLVLDGDYYSRLSHQPGFDNGTNYGWKGIYGQSAGWASADPNVRGIGCAPQAIACITGRLLPLSTPTMKQQILSLGGLGILIEYNTWWNTSTRTQCASLDVVFGAGKADGAAAVLIKNP